MDVVKTYVSLFLCMLIFSMPLVAEEAELLEETNEGEAGTYLIDESDSQVILEGELTPEGQRALEQARQNGELPSTEVITTSNTAADSKVAR